MHTGIRTEFSKLYSTSDLAVAGFFKIWNILRNTTRRKRRKQDSQVVVVVVIVLFEFRDVVFMNYLPLSQKEEERDQPKSEPVIYLFISSYLHHI